MQGKAKNGTASNRDNVFESGFTLAAGILDALKPDWTKNYQLVQQHLGYRQVACGVDQLLSPKFSRAQFLPPFSLELQGYRVEV